MLKWKNEGDWIFYESLVVVDKATLFYYEELIW